MNAPLQKDAPNTERWTLIRDVGVLQVKLVVDGLRDLVLVPLSLIAGIVSLVATRDGRPGPQFYQLMAWGKESEHWINLFAASKNAPVELEETRVPGNRDIDEIVERFESFVKDEVRRGGVTSQAKGRLDKILDALERKKKKP